MLKYASKLSDDYEYAVVWLGQSNATPNGTQNEGFSEDPHLVPRTVGADVSILVAGLAGTGTETVTASDLGTAGWEDAELRLGRPSSPLAGHGIVASSTSLTLTLTWGAAAALPTADTVTIVNSGTTATVTYTTHVHNLSIGSTITISGASLAANNGTFTVTGVPETGQGYVVTYTMASAPGSNPTGTITLTPITIGAYLTYRDGRFRKYDKVRVLTPYLPDAMGDYPAGTPVAPGYTVPATITSYEDLGVFLPFTFFEGIQAYGVNQVAGGGLSLGANATEFFITNPIPVDYFDTATITVIHGGGTSTGTVTTGGAAFPVTLAISAWGGAGTPSGDESLWTYSVTKAGVTLTEEARLGGGPCTAVASGTFTFLIGVTVNVLAGGYIRVQHAGGLSWAQIASNTANVATLEGAWQGVGTPTGDTFDFVYEMWVPHYLNSPYSYPLGSGFLYPSNESTPIAATINRPKGNTTYGWGTRWGALLSFASRLSDAIGRRINVIPLAVDGSSLVSTYNLVGGATNGWWGPHIRCDWSPQTPNGLAARLSKLIRTIAPAALTAEGNTKPLRIIGLSGFFCETEATRKDGRKQAKNVIPMFWDWVRNEVFEAGLCPYESRDQIPVIHPRLPTSPWELATGTSGISGGGDTDGEVNKAIVSFTSKDQFAGTIDTNDSPQKSGEEIHFDGVGEAINGKLVAEEMVWLIDQAYSIQVNPADPGLVEICNLALSHIGAAAKMTALTNTSAEAMACAKFLPICIDMLLQKRPWSFSTRRMPLERVYDATHSGLPYAYGYPTNAVRVFKVMPEGGGDDDGMRFETEQDDDGHRIIFTQAPNAVGAYNVLVVDTKVYSPLFVDCLAMLLASKLAGTIMKGTKGIELGLALERKVMIAVGEASTSDAQQRDPTAKDWVPGSIQARRS